MTIDQIMETDRRKVRPNGKRGFVITVPCPSVTGLEKMETTDYAIWGRHPDLPGVWVVRFEKSNLNK